MEEYKMLYGDYIDKIRKLPQENKYLIGLKVIEYQHEQGHITEEQALDKAVGLIRDFLKEKQKKITIYNCDDEMEVTLKTEVKINDKYSSEKALFKVVEFKPDINGNEINLKSKGGKQKKRNSAIIGQYVEITKFSNSNAIVISDIYDIPRYINIDRKTSGYYINRLIPIYAELFIKLYADYTYERLDIFKTKYDKYIIIDKENLNGKDIYIFRTSVNKLAYLLSIITTKYINSSLVDYAGKQEKVSLIEKLNESMNDNISLYELKQVLTILNKELRENIIYNVLDNLKKNYNALEYSTNYLLTYEENDPDSTFKNQIHYNTNQNESTLITGIKADVLKAMGFNSVYSLLTSANGKRIPEFYKKATHEIDIEFNKPFYELKRFSNQIEIRISNFEPLKEILSSDKYSNFDKDRNITEIKERLIETALNEIKTNALRTNAKADKYDKLIYDRAYNNAINSFKESKDYMEYYNMGIYTNSDIIEKAEKIAKAELIENKKFRHNDIESYVKHCGSALRYLLIKTL